MQTYIYPQNLKSQARLWLWNLKDLMAIGIALLISVLALSQTGILIPMAGTLLFAFLTIRLEDASILDFIVRAVRFFLSSQQYYEWRAGFYDTTYKSKQEVMNKHEVQ